MHSRATGPWILGRLANSLGWYMVLPGDLIFVTLNIVSDKLRHQYITFVTLAPTKSVEIESLWVFTFPHLLYTEYDYIA